MTELQYKDVVVDITHNKILKIFVQEKCKNNRLSGHSQYHLCGCIYNLYNRLFLNKEVISKHVLNYEKLQLNYVITSQKKKQRRKEKKRRRKHALQSKRRICWKLLLVSNSFSLLFCAVMRIPVQIQSTNYPALQKRTLTILTFRKIKYWSDKSA